MDRLYNQIEAVLMAITFAAFSLGINFSDFSLPEVFTANRLALAILTLLIILRIWHKPRVVVTVPIRILVVQSLFIAAVGVISFLASPYQNLVSPTPIVNWILIAFTIIVSGIILTDFDFEQYHTMYKTIIVLATFTTLYTVLWVGGNLGLETGSALRWFMHNNISVGLNRYMTGLFSLNAIPLAIAIGVQRASRSLRLISICSVLAFLILTLLSGSRQTLLITLFYLLVLIIQFISMSSYRAILYDIGKVIISIVLIVAVFYYLSDSMNMLEWFEQRFILRTQHQMFSEVEESRKMVAMTALSYAWEKPFFGIGPGVFPKIYGMYPHNGYLSLLLDFGIVALAIAAFGVMAAFTTVIFTAWRPCQERITTSRESNMHLVMISLAIAFVGVGVMFNDLFQESVLWLVFTLMSVSTRRV